MISNSKELENLADKIHNILYVLEIYCKQTENDIDLQAIHPLIQIMLKDSAKLYCKIVDPEEN